MPAAICLLIVLASRDANGIGTPFAILTIITAPLGLLIGALAGLHQGRTGNWRGLLHATTNQQAPSSASLETQFKEFERRLLDLPEDAVRTARGKYLNLRVSEFQNLRPNYELYAILLLSSLLIPFLIFVPIKLAWNYFHQRKVMRDHIQRLAQTWSMRDFSFPA
ncbi:MAG: hypothetical protein SFX18_03475 [Pirellulales bacterium]|nr:hypothetical protein [Pirellulales bacterium]